jgi:hypothetical protein
VAINTNLTYRWGGTAVGYVEISKSLALGETDATAYRGDRGATAYSHSQTISGNPHKVSKADLGLDNISQNEQLTSVAYDLSVKDDLYISDDKVKFTYNTSDGCLDIIFP